MKRPILIVAGTRAEALKLAPLYFELQKSLFTTLLCTTFQHSTLSNQVFNLFKIKPDFNLKVMKNNQDLFYITNKVLKKTKDLYLQINPSLVIVHGDTTTTMASALSAFYLQIPIAHVEAGLRTGNMLSPFPEEMNRKIVGQIASYNFAPTPFSTANLLSEGIPRSQVFCTGNTIVDSLNIIKEKIYSGSVKPSQYLKQKIDSFKSKNKKIVLLTAHRRESFNGGLERIFSAIKEFVNIYKDVEIFFPVHPNPNVKFAIEQSKIKNIQNINFLEPIDYKDLIYLLINSDWVASDSGGIQEEAVSLGKKILVLRDITERWEGIWEGTEVLVGTDKDKIFKEMEKSYFEKNNPEPSSVYGDGRASERIVSILKTKLYKQKHNISRKTFVLENNISWKKYQ